MYNVNLRRVRESIVAVEKQEALHILNVCMQNVRTMLFCYLLFVYLHYTFPRYRINGTIFGKEVLNTKCGFGFYLQYLSEKNFELKRSSARSYHKYKNFFM
jgi:hypothetical protein